MSEVNEVTTGDAGGNLGQSSAASKLFNPDYTVQLYDVGLPMKRVAATSLVEEVPLTEEEKQLLDKLMFEGVAKKAFTLQNGTVAAFRTVSKRGVNVSVNILLKKGDNQDINPGILRQTMGIALHLCRLGEKDFETEKDFEDTASIQERLDFILSLPDPLVNSLGVMQSAFSMELGRVTNVKAVENF